MIATAFIFAKTNCLFVTLQFFIRNPPDVFGVPESANRFWRCTTEGHDCDKRFADDH